MLKKTIKAFFVGFLSGCFLGYSINLYIYLCLLGFLLVPFFAFLLLFWAVFGWSGLAWCWWCCCIWSLLGFSWLVVALSGFLALSLSDYSIMRFCASCGFWRGLGFFFGRWWQHLGAFCCICWASGLFWGVLGASAAFWSAALHLVAAAVVVVWGEYNKVIFGSD